MKKHCFISYSYSLAILISGFFYVHNVFAGPADYVYTPKVEYGEREIDIKAGTTSSLNGNRAQGASIGFGYGASEHWFTEVYLKQERNGNGPANLAEFENKFQLTDTGEYPARSRHDYRTGGAIKRRLTLRIQVRAIISNRIWHVPV